jgi:SOS-response transcriptional repressor LexA
MKRGEREGADSGTAAGTCTHPATQTTRGGAPIYLEVVGHLGVMRWAVYQHGRALERKGALSTALRHRGSPLGQAHVPPAGLPIMGYLAGVRPILPGETLEGYPEINRLLEGRSNLIVLQVKGDSIVHRQISQGDNVLVRAQPWVEHEVVGVVVIDAGVMVKTMLRQRTGPWPRPENQQPRHEVGI